MGFHLRAGHVVDGDVADVPDPYYGRDRDFEIVLDLCEAATPKWLDEVAARTT